MGPKLTYSPPCSRATCHGHRGTDAAPGHGYRGAPVPAGMVRPARWGPAPGWAGKCSPVTARRHHCPGSPATRNGQGEADKGHQVAGEEGGAAAAGRLQARFCAFLQMRKPRLRKAKNPAHVPARRQRQQDRLVCSEAHAPPRAARQAGRTRGRAGGTAAPGSRAKQAKDGPEDVQPPLPGGCPSWAPHTRPCPQKVHVPS